MSLPCIVSVLEVLVAQKVVWAGLSVNSFIMLLKTCKSVREMRNDMRKFRSGFSLMEEFMSTDAPQVRLGAELSETVIKEIWKNATTIHVSVSHREKSLEFTDQELCNAFDIAAAILCKQRGIDSSVIQFAICKAVFMERQTLEQLWYVMLPRVMGLDIEIYHGFDKGYTGYTHKGLFSAVNYISMYMNASFEVYCLASELTVDMYKKWPEFLREVEGLPSLGAIAVAIWKRVAEEQQCKIEALLPVIDHDKCPPEQYKAIERFVLRLEYW